MNITTAYHAMRENTLSCKHRQELESESAIDPVVIAERGYFTAYHPNMVPETFAEGQRRPGLVIPICDTTGRLATYQLKADDSRLNANGTPIKYDTAVHGQTCLDIPPRSRNYLPDPAVPLWITEGAKKVDAGLSQGILCIIGVQGVYGWRGRNSYGGKTALPDWEAIALNDREVVIAFDSDVMTKASVRDALERLSAFLRQRGARVRYLLLPGPGFEGRIG
jgi:hypothetical protein